MAIPTHTIVFGIQAILRLGNAAKRAYQDKILDEDFVAPGIDQANLDVPTRAVIVVSAAMTAGKLDRGKWAADHDRVNAGDASPEGLAAQNRLISIAAEIDPAFAKHSTNAGLTILHQWSSAAQRQSPIGRIGIELADIALDYFAANPGLFGIEGNGTKLVTSVAVNLGKLLPDPDNPNPPVENFAAGAIRVFVEAGLRAVSNNVDNFIDEAHLQDIARSTLQPLIEAVAKPGTANQPWYDLRDEFLGPISEAAIDAIARNQVALLGESFATTKRIGALTHSVLLAIKDNGIGDDLGKEGLLRVYGTMLDTVAQKPSLFLGSATSNTDKLVEKLLVNTATLLKRASPPFDKALGMNLIASSFGVVSANVALIVSDLNPEDWTETVAELSETLVRDLAAGIAAGVRGNDRDVLQRVFSKDQGAKFIDIVVSAVSKSPNLVAREGSPELKTLVEILARAMSEPNGRLFSGEDWLEVASMAAREVAANPGRLIKLDGSAAENHLLSSLLSTVLNAAADATDSGRNGGSVLFGDLLREATRTVIEIAAGNAARAQANQDSLAQYLKRLNEFAMGQKDKVGSREWLYLFRLHIAQVIHTGKLPSLDDNELLHLLLDR